MIQNHHFSPIPKTSFLVGTFFTASYSKTALVTRSTQQLFPEYHYESPFFVAYIASRKWIGCKIVANLQHATQHNGNFVSLISCSRVDPSDQLATGTFQNIIWIPLFAGLLHQANGSRARLLPTYSTQPNTMVIYDGYLTSSSSLSVPYLGSKSL